MKKMVLTVMVALAMTAGLEGSVMADALSEEEAWAEAEAGTLESSPEDGYEFNETMDRWFYSNYPNYKDFNADGEIKVAYVCKFSGAWFTPKSDAMRAAADEFGYTYTFIDAGQDEQAWLDGVQNIINQDYDIAVLTPVNSTLLPQAIEMLQEAGIAYFTTDDPGADATGFYVPHYGLDDYDLYYQVGKRMAQSMLDEDFMANVADDYSNFLFVLEDSPDVEALHKRNSGIYDAVKEAFPEIPEERVSWIDCQDGLADQITEKFSNVLQANKDQVEYWLIASPSGTGLVPTMTLFTEAGVNIADCVRLEEGISMPDPCEMMIQNEDVASACWGVGLVSAPSGTGIMNVVHELVENKTPIPAFTGYDLIVLNKDNIEEFYNTYIAQ